MAAPNIVNTSTITGKTSGAVLTGSSVAILTNSAGSGQVWKINSIYVTNVTGSNATLTASFYDAATTTQYRLAYAMVVPTTSTLDLFSKYIYLKEGDILYAQTGTSSALEMVVSYEVIS
jgi:hypothetical protein